LNDSRRTWFGKIVRSHDFDGIFGHEKGLRQDCNRNCSLLSKICDGRSVAPTEKPQRKAMNSWKGSSQVMNRGSMIPQMQIGAAGAEFG